MFYSINGGILMSEEEKKKKPKLRGWIGRKAGAEDVHASTDEKLASEEED